MQYFGSNIVEGVAESWVEAEISWVEVDGAGLKWVEVGARFSDTPVEKVSAEKLAIGLIIKLISI